MKLYLSIPITGYEQGNEPLARRLAAALEERGYEVVVPHDLSAPDHPDKPCPGRDTYPGVTGDTHGGICYLREDIREMLTCDAVVVAPGWFASRGCKAEVATARSVDMPVYGAFEVIHGQEITQ